MYSPAIVTQLYKLNRLSLPDERSQPQPGRHLVVNTSGRDGSNGRPGVNGSSSGCPGGYGEDGDNGSNALPVTATLHVDSCGQSSRQVVFTHSTSASPPQSATLPLSDPRTSIFLCARGGHGGHGGQGGQGERGHYGASGKNATHNHAAKDGGPGGPGGNGGNGGAGGSAGSGAPITLTVHPQDTDLLLLLKSPPVTQAGTPGSGAPGGAGGPGGYGGPGGKSYSGTEMRGNVSVTVYHKAGKHGPPGLPGRDGAHGPDGAMGTDGSFSIKVGATGIFPWRYDLDICQDLTIDDWLSSGVIEPGTCCAVHYSVQNCGAMPTPDTQDIFLSAEDTPWVRPVTASGAERPAEPRPGSGNEGGQTISGVVALQRAIPAGAVSTPSAPFHVAIANVNTPTAGPALLLHTRVFHKATLTRINQDFPLISDLATILAVSYPLVMTPAVGHVCVLPGREGVIAWKVRNVSNQAIGLDAGISRLAATRLQHRAEESANRPDERGRTLRDAEVDMGCVSSAVYPKNLVHLGKINDMNVNFMASNPQPPPVNIDLIEPEEEFLICWLVAVGEATHLNGDSPSKKSIDRQATQPEHSVIYLNTHLDLGHPLQRHSLCEIQVRPFQIQVASPFNYTSGVSRALLVVNDRTTSSELHQWRQLCGVLSGTPPDAVSVWNQSLYGGFSFKYIVGEDECLGELFGGKPSHVVVLNNRCTPNGIRTGAPEEAPLQHFHCDELIDAVKNRSCNVYVFGSHLGVQLKSVLNVQVKDMEERELDDEKALKEWSPSILFPHVWPGPVVKSSKKGPSTSSEIQCAAGNAEIKGFLQKTKRSGKGKVKRYFVLRKGQGILAYYNNATAKVPKNSFELSKCKLLEGEEDIQLETPDRLLALSIVDKGDDIQSWRSHIAEAIQHAQIIQEQEGEEQQPKQNVHDKVSGFDLGTAPGANVRCIAKVVKLVGTGEKSLKSKAEKLAKELASACPETSFITVYRHFKDGERLKKNGAFARGSAIGEISVHGGVENDGGRVVMDVPHGIPEETASGGDVSGSVNIYGCMKALSFDRKAELLRLAQDDGHLAQQDSTLEASALSILVDAVLSDVADELSLFTFGNENMGAMLRNMLSSRGRSETKEQWRSRMCNLSTLDKDDVFGSISYPSVKFDECIRLTVALHMLSNVVAPVKTGNVGRRGIIAQGLLAVVERMKGKLFAAAGDESDATVSKDSASAMFAKRLKEWSKDGLPVADQGVKAKELVETLRTLRGLHQPTVETKGWTHVPMVLSWAEWEELRATGEERKELPKIRKEPGLMRSDAERVGAVRELVRSHDPYPETVEPILK